MRAALFVALLGLLATGAAAHELSGSTATVSLRDGLITIDANLDIVTWLSSQPEGDLTAMVAAARAQAQAIVVQVDGVAVALELLHFPTTRQVHAVLQRPAPADHRHAPKIVAVQWRALKAVPTAKSVTVRFPLALGPILVAFVEPRSQILGAGQAARFPTRQAARRP